MRDFARRHQLFTFGVLFLIIFIIVRWVFRIGFPLDFQITPEEVELILQMAISFALTIAVWILTYGYQRVEPGTAVIVKGMNNQIWTHLRRLQKPGEPTLSLPDCTDNDGWYLSIPLIQKVLAIMPDYQFTFEFPIKDIDTQTLKLARINEIEVRVTCRITDHRTFYFDSAALFDRIQQIETQEKLTYTDPLLWKKIVKEAVRLRLDDGVRDVVWRWHEHIARDPSLLMRAAFTLAKPSELDPYDLSVNRGNLARHVLREMHSITQEWGISLVSLVFEKIEIDQETIKRKTRNKESELPDAAHEAGKEAEAIKVKGFAEAEVRAKTLGLLLEELITKRGMKLDDPIISQIVRAALYSDGEMIWKGVLEKSATGDGKAKTA